MDTIKLARLQGYRAGYAQALADMRRELSHAMDVAFEKSQPADYVTALQHARAISKGLAEKAKRREQ